jgi:hypothetical protein
VAVPAWATVLLTLGSAAIAASAALGGTLLQMRHAARAREVTERRERVERGAAVVAPVLTFLTDADPDKIGTLGVDGLARLDDLSEKWSKLKTDLTGYAAAHAQLEVLAQSDAIVMAVSSCLNETRSAVRLSENPQGLDPSGKRQIAEMEWAEARKLARGLLRLLRGETEADWLRAGGGE